jgi:hypothetical protein
MIDAYNKGVEERRARERMEAERKRLEMEKALHEEQMRQMRLQTEQMRIELQRQERAVRAETEKLKQAALPPDPATVRSTPDEEVRAAIATMAQRHSDFEAYIDRISALADLLKPSADSQLSVLDYLESIYSVAKHASLQRNGLPTLTEAKPSQPGTSASKPLHRATVTCPIGWPVGRAGLLDVNGMPTDAFVDCGARVTLVDGPGSLTSRLALIVAGDGTQGYLTSSWIRQ